MTATAILDYWNRIILLAIGVQRVETHQNAKVRQNRSIGWKDIKIFSIFKDGGRPPSWIHLGHIWTTHNEYFGSLISPQNLVMIDAVIFYNMNISIFGALSWKMNIHAPKMFFGQFDPLNGLQYQPKPKKHTILWVHIIWAIKHENVVTCRWVA